MEGTSSKFSTTIQPTERCVLYDFRELWQSLGSVKSLKSLITQRCHGSVQASTAPLSGQVAVRTTASACEGRLKKAGVRLLKWGTALRQTTRKDSIVKAVVRKAILSAPLDLITPCNLCSIRGEPACGCVGERKRGRGQSRSPNDFRVNCQIF